MLVLSRKLGERIIMTGGITVSVVEITGNRVKLGIEAPQEVKIIRQELNDGKAHEGDGKAHEGDGKAAKDRRTL